MADINVERKKGGPGILPWILGLLLLAALIFGISRCRDEDPAPVVPADTVTDTVSSAPMPAAPIDSAAGMGAAAAGAGAAAAGGALALGQIMGAPDASAGQTVSGTARVTEVVSDRGFWVEEGGQRMFVVLAEPQSAERRIDINQGQTVQLSGTVQKGGTGAQTPAGLEQEAQQIAQKEAAFLMVRPADVTISGQ